MLASRYSFCIVPSIKILFFSLYPLALGKEYILQSMLITLFMQEKYSSKDENGYKYTSMMGIQGLRDFHGKKAM